VLERPVVVAVADPTSSGRRWLAATNVATVGALVGAVVLAPSGTVRPGIALALLLFVGSSVHVASTAWLGTLSSVRECARRRSARFLLAPLACVGVGSLIGAVTNARTLSVILAVFFSWQFFHFAKQNVGIVALATSSHCVAPMRLIERRCVVVAGCAGIVGLLARPSLLQLHEPISSHPVFDLAAIGFLMTVAIGVSAFARRPLKDRPAPVVIAYGLGLGFSAPIFLFASPYAAVAGMTIAHGIQYLGIVGWIALGPATTRHRTRAVAMFLNIALLGGAALATASHLHGHAGVEGGLFGAYLGLVSAHFVVDAGLWRLSDPASRRFVTSALPDLVNPGSGRTVRPATSSADI
jgi:MFS family permease